jgi:hypothetical protein
MSPEDGQKQSVTPGAFYGKAEGMQEETKKGIEKAEAAAEERKAYNRMKKAHDQMKSEVAALAAENLSLKLKLDKASAQLPSGLVIHDSELLMRTLVALVLGHGLRFKATGGMRTIGKIFGGTTYIEEKRNWEKVRDWVTQQNLGGDHAESDGAEVEDAGVQESEAGEVAAQSGGESGGSEGQIHLRDSEKDLSGLEAKPEEGLGS